MQRINNRREDDESKEHHVEFLETWENPPESLQSTKQSLDFVAPLVHLTVVLPRVDSRSLRWHHWIISQGQCQLPSLVSLVRSVHDQRGTALLLAKPLQQLTAFRGIVGLSW